MKAIYFLSILTLLLTGCDRREKDAGGEQGLKDKQQREESTPKKKEVIPRDTAPRESLPKSIIPEGQEEPYETQDPDEYDSSMGSGTNADPYGSPTEDSGVRE